MSEERLNEIKDSVNFKKALLLAPNMNTLCVDEEQELIEEINRLNNLINELEKFLNKVVETGSSIEQITCKNIFNYLQELKENNNE